MDISKMKSLTQGMKNIKAGENGTSQLTYEEKYGEETLQYFNKGMDYLNAGDNKNAIKFLEKVHQQIPSAFGMLFVAYANLDNKPKGIECLKNGAKAGNALCMTWLGDVSTGEDEELATYWYKKAADLGFIDAMNRLADCYASGTGVPQNYSKVFYWAKKANETTPNDDPFEGNCTTDAPATAKFNLGMCYLNGIGTEENPAESFSLLKKSADLGHSEAMLFVGSMYLNGVGVIQNKTAAGTWFKKSADAGNTEAMIAYGNYVEEAEKDGIFDHVDKFDKDTKENPLTALLGSALTVLGSSLIAPNYYEQAAKAGNMEGYFHLAGFYYKKANSSENMTDKSRHENRLKAIKYATKGVEGNNVNCLWLLGTIWENVYDVLDSNNANYYKNELIDVVGDSTRARAANLAANCYEHAAKNGIERAAQDLQNFKDKFNRNNSGCGCFITTAVCGNFGKPDDCYELTAFRNFRDTWLINQPDGKSLIEEYYQIAPKIVSKIDSLPSASLVYKKIWEKYLSKCLNFIERGDNQSCKQLYIKMVTNLKKIF